MCGKCWKVFSADLILPEARPLKVIAVLIGSPWCERSVMTPVHAVQLKWKRSDFSERPRSIHLTPTAPNAMHIWLHYQMQLLSWKQLRLVFLDAALKEIDARLIGKEGSFIEFLTQSQIFSEINQNILLNFIKIFTHLRVRIPDKNSDTEVVVGAGCSY